MLVDLATVPPGQAVVLVLAGNPTPPPDKGDEFGKASPVGLVVILLLLMATVFLVRSMTRHLRRVPESFDDPAAGPTGPDAPGPADAAPGDGAPRVGTDGADVPGSPDGGPAAR